MVYKIECLWLVIRRYQLSITKEPRKRKRLNYFSVMKLFSYYIPRKEIFLMWDIYSTSTTTSTATSTYIFIFFPSYQKPAYEALYMLKPTSSALLSISQCKIIRTKKKHKTKKILRNKFINGNKWIDSLKSHHLFGSIQSINKKKIQNKINKTSENNLNWKPNSSVKFKLKLLLEEK